MIIGVLSDTHEDKANALPHILREFRRRNVELVIHCGDVEPKHLDSFGDFPVICALNAEQLFNPAFREPSLRKWAFTKPGDRIIAYKGVIFYVGHKRSWDFLIGSEGKLAQIVQEVRKDNDGLRYFLSGHTHHQIFSQDNLVSFINPGAVEGSFDGYEFAIIDTDTNEVVFSRIPVAKPVIDEFSVGVISDSLNISKMDPCFWGKLADEFRRRGIKHIIHCGNISLADIGRKELAGFEIFCNLRPDQERPCALPRGWQLISLESPVVEINDYRFCVQLDLGATLMDRSEVDMHRLSIELRRRYPEIGYVLCGSSNGAFLEEGKQVRIINPGDVLRSRNFCVITLPRAEITFGHIPADPLPSIG